MGNNIVRRVTGLEHCRLPQPRRLANTTPSRAAGLAECGLRTAYASDDSFGSSAASTRAARLGTVCHRVLEAAGAGELPARMIQIGEPPSNNSGLSRFQIKRGAFEKTLSRPTGGLPHHGRTTRNERSRRADSATKSLSMLLPSRLTPRKRPWPCGNNDRRRLMDTSSAKPT